jgi:hypothetical protein
MHRDTCSALGSAWPCVALHWRGLDVGPSTQCRVRGTRRCNQLRHVRCTLHQRCASGAVTPEGVLRSRVGAPRQGSSLCFQSSVSALAGRLFLYRSVSGTPTCGRAPRGARLPAGGIADQRRSFNSLIDRRFLPRAGIGAPSPAPAARKVLFFWERPREAARCGECSLTRKDLRWIRPLKDQR